MYVVGNGQRQCRNPAVGNGYTWHKSGDRKKKQWLVKCGRKLIGRCSADDDNKLADVISKHRAEIDSAASAAPAKVCQRSPICQVVTLCLFAR